MSNSKRDKEARRIRELAERVRRGDGDPQAVAELGSAAAEYSAQQVRAAEERLDKLLARAVVVPAPPGLSRDVLAQVRAEGRPRVVMPRRKPSRTGMWLSVAAVGLALVVGLLTVLPGISGALGFELTAGDVAPLLNYLPMVAALAFAAFSVIRTLVNLRRDQALRRYAKQGDGS